jgi:hypothetical protein
MASERTTSRAQQKADYFHHRLVQFEHRLIAIYKMYRTLLPHVTLEQWDDFYRQLLKFGSLVKPEFITTLHRFHDDLKHILFAYTEARQIYERVRHKLTRGEYMTDDQLEEAALNIELAFETRVHEYDIQSVIERIVELNQEMLNPLRRKPSSSHTANDDAFAILLNGLFMNALEDYVEDMRRRRNEYYAWSPPRRRSSSNSSYVSSTSSPRRRSSSNSSRHISVKRRALSDHSVLQQQRQPLSTNIRRRSSSKRRHSK